ncbi:hypothetical protein ACFLXA_01570 [Chloroflexota bacterium]
MDIYRISDQAAESLINLPESGMGFQVIRYRSDNFIVINATIIFPLNNITKRGFSEEEYRLLYYDPTDPEASQISQLEIMDLPGELPIVFSHLDRELQDIGLELTFNKTATSPPEYVISPRRPYSYYRFCAYPYDKRVDKKTGNFFAGTYATTYNDLHFVPSGFAAVGRYAIPIPTSAQFVSQIITCDPPTLMGTSPPNFGQAGGGVEVLFNSGATNNPGRSFTINTG